ncbi:hypothetical protein DESC_610263 [Desulfosarcina cetonica]|nr:hypothetical protein DESC_610263 [Desulfosarcina cetonica]
MDERNFADRYGIRKPEPRAIAPGSGFFLFGEQSTISQRIRRNTHASAADMELVFSTFNQFGIGFGVGLGAQRYHR